MANIKMATKEKISLGQAIKMDKNISQAKGNNQIHRDALIEDFSFQHELGGNVSATPYETILKTLPCYFNWDLEESCDEDVQVLVQCAHENLVSNTEMTLVPHKTMLGYLYVTQLRRMEDREPSTALSWFDQALSDNQLDTDRCSDNDGPRGDTLILLSNIAWVYFTSGRLDMVDKTLQKIKQKFANRISESQKAFMYGHKGICFAYFLKTTFEINIACFNRALSVFPCHTDWLFWSAFTLCFQKDRCYEKPFETDAKSVLHREEILYKHVLENDNNHCFAKAMLGNLFHNKGQYDNANSLISDALKLNRTLPIVAEFASIFYAALKNFKLSIKVLEQALEAWPNNTYLLRQIAYTYKEIYLLESAHDQEQNSNHLEMAIRYYDKAIKVANGHLPEAIINKAKVCKLMGNMVEAHRLYLLAINTNRDPYWKSVTYFEFGEFCEQHLEEHSDALKYYQLAIDQGTQYWCAKRAAHVISHLTLEKSTE
ncbi:interferon-induced protein with tetratricopeptide repeats 3-like [Ptychodera flava]|uniref:interferon-induced protein with tetratricopeptide repeats 3-like n=1 Tax=Ptychodera flava TaxID=63121 RepID=UPI00396A2591